MSGKQNINSSTSGTSLAGLVLTAAGVLLLFRQFNWFAFPSWLFSWPMILIIIGLVKRANNPQQKSGWLVLVLVGLLFLLDKIFTDINFVQLGWPIVIIGIGFYLILRQRQVQPQPELFDQKGKFTDDDFLNPQPAAPADNAGPTINTYKNDDYLSSFCIFSDVKKNIFSKTFKGGEVVNIFGGTHVDFSHADLNGQVVVDVMQLFGGTKLIVPPHWRVVTDIATIFGGVNDKRISHADAATSGKLLVLKGASIFGGVDIKSF